jgi:adenosylcobinamide kinase/adenosylcobinamide-phosphate guanylyltransferase
MGPSDQVLIDSLGTWVSQGLELEDSAWSTACDQLLGMLESSPARLLLVSEQAGWGVVPATAIGGLFRDRLGELEERIGRRCCQLWLVVAGRAVDLLPISQPIPPT